MLKLELSLRICLTSSMILPKTWVELLPPSIYKVNNLKGVSFCQHLRSSNIYSNKKTMMDGDKLNMHIRNKLDVSEKPIIELPTQSQINPSITALLGFQRELPSVLFNCDLRKQSLFSVNF